MSVKISLNKLRRKVKIYEGGKFLNLREEGIDNLTEIEGLGTLQDLVFLHLDYNRISKIQNLDSRPNLEVLDLSSCRIEQIEGLDSLARLKVLNLANNRIRHIQGLDCLTNLEVLSLSGNRLTEITGLQKLRNLRVLTLYANQIGRIEGLENLTNLRVLHLYQNRISKIEGLDTLSQLRELYLIDNKIPELTGLDNLTNLRVLHLNGNRISKIEGLDTLSQLRELDLRYNIIPELTGLENLANLKILRLDVNPVHNWAKRYIRKAQNAVTFCRNGKNPNESPAGPLVREDQRTMDRIMMSPQSPGPRKRIYIATSIGFLVELFVLLWIVFHSTALGGGGWISALLIVCSMAGIFTSWLHYTPLVKEAKIVGDWYLYRKYNTRFKTGFCLSLVLLLYSLFGVWGMYRPI